MGRNGSGVKPASKTSIEITFVYRDVRCRERIKLKPTAANLIKAERHRSAILNAIDNNTFDYATTFPGSKNIGKFHTHGGLTVKTYLLEWLDDKEPTIKVSTFTDYQKTVNILINQFGNILLHELQRKDVYEWAKTLTCSNKRISNILSPFRSALDHATHNGIIEINPIAGWHYKRIEPPRKESDVDAFNKAEQEAILNALNGQHKNLIQFAFWSGLRTSELVGLEWGDIDFVRNTVMVQRAKTQYSKKPETTKTKAGKREVKLLSPAIQAINNQKQYSFLAGNSVFKNPNTNKDWVGDQQIRKFWKWALKRAGVRYRRPYQTRHTYASMMLSSGEPLAWVSSQLGHSSVTTTARIYAKFIPDSRPEASNKAVELFG